MFLFACNNGNSNKNRITEDKDNDIVFDTVTASKFYHLNNDSTMPSCNLNINILFPKEYENTEVMDKLKRIFITTIFDESYLNMKPLEAIEKYSKIYIDNYIKDAKYYFDESSLEHDEYKDRYFSYYENISNEVKFNKGNILSVQFMQSNKKSNNDSYRQYLNKVIDLSNGNVLQEADIFTENYEKFLNIVFRNKLLEANKVKSINELEELGFFGIEEIMPNGNFSVNNEGITYIFNKGEYSVLKSNEIRIYLPYKEIKDILKENSPISLFYSK